ncbi:MAG: NUDIX hydrolase [Deltaproteobacteria bacterium]|nr:NUDIX hydrolase [Deltaproteobacteria bacterium]
MFRVVGHAMSPGSLQRRRAPYEVVTLELPDWVTVVACRQDGTVVLVRQLRYGTNTPSLETPGGILDAGESPLAAARRELREETGHRATRWRSLGWVFPNPSLQSNRLHLFLALDAREVSPATPDEGEGLEVERVDLTKITRLLRRGAVRHALSALALERALAVLGR